MLPPCWVGIWATKSSVLPAEKAISRAVVASGQKQGSGVVSVTGCFCCAQATHSSDVPLQ